jgi:hypothetical protein
MIITITALIPATSHHQENTDWTGAKIAVTALSQVNTRLMLWLPLSDMSPFHSTKVKPGEGMATSSTVVSGA